MDHLRKLGNNNNNNKSSIPHDIEPSVAQEDTVPLLKRCKLHIKEVLNVLEKLQPNDSELIKTTQRMNGIIDKCLNDCGELTEIHPSSIFSVLSEIRKYEKKIQQLQGSGNLLRWVTQRRLRGNMEKIAQRITLQIQTLLGEIQIDAAKFLQREHQEEFLKIMKDIENETTVTAKPILAPSILTDSERMPSDSQIITLWDNEISIQKDVKLRTQLLNLIPKLGIRPLSNSQEIAAITTKVPNDETEKVVSDYMCGRSVSSYPSMPDTGKREGDPICDQYCATHFENRTILVIGDGCGWGDYVREAARLATKMALKYLLIHQHQINTTEDAALYLMRAFQSAHNSICYGRTEETLFLAGTTTMMIGMALELEQPKDSKSFAFVLCSVGDCKAYCYKIKEKRLEEITKGNREGNDARDPGGRLGPTLGVNGDPDLRNLRLQIYYCDPEDIILMVSDGVHDNLDPYYRGLTPKEIGIEVEGNLWENIPNEIRKQKSCDWIEEYMINLLKNGPITCQNITAALLENSIKTTWSSRNFLETNPGRKIPSDRKQFPGKMDHTTCIAIKIGLRTRKGKAVPSKNAPSPSKSVSSKPNNINVSPQRGSDFYDEFWEKRFNTLYIVPWSQFISGLGIPVNEEDEQILKTILDDSDTATVIKPKFNEFLKAFGPIEKCIENVKKLVAADWFHGFISSAESKKFLEQTIGGTFIVRFSGSRPGSFVLDYSRGSAGVRSVRLNHQPNGGFIAPIEGGSERVFTSLHELVETYRKMGVLGLPFSSSLPQKPWFFGDVTREEANELLKDQHYGTFIIRFSNQPGCYAASFVGEGNSVKKGLLTKTEKGYQVNHQGLIFKSLDELIEHYIEQKIFVAPYSGN